VVGLRLCGPGFEKHQLRVTTQLGERSKEQGQKRVEKEKNKSNSEAEQTRKIHYAKKQKKNKNKEAIPVRPDIQGLRIVTPGLSSYLTYEVLRLLHTSLLACSNLSAYSTVLE
jgi:hypothetical protein